jgi:hypothetical protein
VVAIAVQSPERIMLSVERFGRGAPERMEIVRLSYKRSAKVVSREDFCDQLRRVLAENFPDETVEKLSTASDPEHSLSGLYARGISRKGPMRAAFLAVGDKESQDAIESSLTFALLWLQGSRQSATKGNLSFLRLILPEGKSELLAHQLSALDPRLPVQVYELNSLHEHVERVQPCLNGNLNTWPVPHRESELLLSRANGHLARIIAFAPEAIAAHAVPRDHEVILRFRGLPFARWKDHQVFFWAGRNLA